MPLPFIPIGVVVGALVFARNIHISPIDQRVEDRLDDINEGLSAHRDRDSNGQQVNAAYRYKRVIYFGHLKSGIEVDLSALGRIRFRKVS